MVSQYVIISKPEKARTDTYSSTLLLAKKEQGRGHGRAPEAAATPRGLAPSNTESFTRRVGSLSPNAEPGSRGDGSST